MARVAAARRYAQAVLAIALERDELDRWQADMDVMASALAEPRLAALLESPRIHMRDKVRLLREGLAALNPLAINLACLLVARGRLDLVGQVAAEYRRLADARRGIEEAQVTTAVPLEDEEREKLSRHLSAITGKAIRLTTRLDPAIIGGFVARVGDRLIDGSLRSRLRALRQALARGPA